MPSLAQHLQIIQAAKDALKTDPTFLQLCKDFKVSPNFIDLVPVRFGKIDVSAKTDKGIITLNEKLLEENPVKLTSYLCHEATHSLQQTQGIHPTMGADDGPYLDNPFEEEAFQIQLSFLDDHQGPRKTNQYLNQLLDHHQITDPVERLHKKKELLQKIRRT